MTDVADMIWEDPPAPPRAPWTAAFVQRLQRRPGKWCRVVVDGRDTFSGSTAQSLKVQGCELRYKLVSRDPNRFHLWARWPK